LTRPCCCCFSFCCLQTLSAEVASYLGLELGKIKIKRFADGEIYVQVQVSLRTLLLLLCVLACCPSACLLPT
jgi:ribose-phosphate pyrophosphokinase